MTTKPQPAIARVWRGRTTRDRADEYERYNYEVGLKPLMEKALGVQSFREDRAHDTEFVTISYWESVAAMSRFTGGDPTRIHHLDRDAEFLIELPERADPGDPEVARDHRRDDVESQREVHHQLLPRAPFGSQDLPELRHHLRLWRAVSLLVRSRGARRGDSRRAPEAVHRLPVSGVPRGRGREAVGASHCGRPHLVARRAGVSRPAGKAAACAVTAAWCQSPKVWGGAMAGSSSRTIVPSPTLLSISTRPPASTTIC